MGRVTSADVSGAVGIRLVRCTGMLLVLLLPMLRSGWLRIGVAA